MAIEKCSYYKTATKEKKKKKNDTNIGKNRDIILTLGGLANRDNYKTYFSFKIIFTPNPVLRT
jgi:hypothetical protein